MCEENKQPEADDIIDIIENQAPNNDMLLGLGLGILLTLGIKALLK